MSDKENPTPIEHIQLTYTDCSNITRCHVVRPDMFARVVKTGLSFPRPTFTFPWMGGAPVAGPTGQVTFRPDASPPLPAPWLPGVGLSFGLFEEDDGSPFSLCPRTFLHKQESRLKGVRMVLGFELEFLLLNEDRTPVDNSTYSESKILRGKTWKFLCGVVAALEAIGIPVWRYHSEGAAGQLEVAIGPFMGSLLKAADALVLARQAIYHEAAALGCIASFCPKPFQDIASGAHMHISLETDEGANLFQASPKEAQGFLAGILSRLPDLILILSPTGNSYERLQPSSISGAYQCIGGENREAAIRLIKNRDELIQRFEMRPIDGTANPYLIIGSFLAAGMEGLENRSILPEEVTDFNVPGKKNPPPLPSSLAEAIRTFSVSEFNKELYGPELFKLFVDMRTRENEFWESDESMENKIKLLIHRY